MLRMTLMALCVCCPLLAKDYNTAPTLANPAGTTVISVSTVTALQNAVANIQNNQIIEVADGTYTLTQSLFFNSAATVTRTNIGIRSASRNPAACIIQGTGMSSTTGTIPHGIHVSKTNGMLIADLTIRNVYYHAIQIAGETGVTNVHIYNCRLLDTGEQFIKGSTAGFGFGSDNGIVEYTLMKYTTQGTTYTNGVDIHGGDGWIIRHNRFELVNLIPGGVGPAVLMWNGSSNTVCEGNTFINCETAIAFGLVDRTAPDTDHSGGVIRNNFIYRASGTPTGVDTPDCSILVWDSPNTKVLNNTIVQSGSYANGIEYRFSTTGAEIRYNLLDCAIVDRGGGTSGNTVSNNVINAQASWFLGASSGNLRLSATAPATVVDAATAHANVSDDYDGNGRPVGAAPDMGACEKGGTAVTPPSAPTGLNVTANGTLGADASWTDTSSNETGFRIERKQGSGSYATAGSVGAGVTVYADTGLTNGLQYTYRVIAFNGGGDSGLSNEVAITASLAPTVPATPTNFSATAQAALQIALGWTDASSNEDGFRIERNVSGGAFATLTTVAAGATSYTDTALTEGTQYTYRVVAYNTVGDSAASNTASAIASANPPLSGGNGTSGGGGGCSAGEGSAAIAIILMLCALSLRRRVLSV